MARLSTEERRRQNQENMRALLGASFDKAAAIGDRLEGGALVAESVAVVSSAKASKTKRGKKSIVGTTGATVPPSSPVEDEVRSSGVREEWEAVSVSLRREEWVFLNRVAYARFWANEKRATRPSRREHTLAVLLREAIDKYEYPERGPKLAAVGKDEPDWDASRMVFRAKRSEWVRLRRVHEARCLAGGRRGDNTISSLIREAVLGYDWGAGLGTGLGNEAESAATAADGTGRGPDKLASRASSAVAGGAEGRSADPGPSGERVASAEADAD